MLVILLDFTFHFVSIEQVVDEFHAYEFLLIAESHIAVGVCVQRIDGNLTTLGDVAQHHLPDAVQISLCLFTVVVTHLVGSHHLHSTLVFAYLHSLEFNTELGKQVFDVVHFAAQSVPIDHALRVQE